MGTCCGRKIKLPKKQKFIVQVLTPTQQQQLEQVLNDNADMAEKAEEYINAGDVSTTIEVIAEVIYVLKGVYSLDRDKIVDTMKDFMVHFHSAASSGFEKNPIIPCNSKHSMLCCM